MKVSVLLLFDNSVYKLEDFLYIILSCVRK